MNLKKLLLSGFAAMTAMSAAAIAANAASVHTGSVSVTQEASASGVNTRYRTQAEIRSYLAAHPFNLTDDVVYTTSPDLTSPYTNAGGLNSATITNGLNAVNVVRYVAGLSEVTLNSEYNTLCQAGAYVSALNGDIDHYPHQPSGLSSSIFDTGYNACGHSNLAAGIKNLGAATLAYMDDSDSYNIDRLGHRRWILYPAMGKTGFGQVNTGSSGYRYYSAMYAHDRTGTDTDITGVCWPAQNMPIEYFDYDHAWSYSLGSAISNPDGVKVTLTRQSDGKVWNFAKGSKDFYVNNDYYGQPGCVIFRPSGISKYSAGDVYTVKITGTGTTVEYTVNFFSVGNSSNGSNTKPSAVTGFKATDITANSVTLKWDANKNAEYYQIDYYYNGDWHFLTKTSDTSCPVSNLTAGYEYQFRIFAFNGSLYSSATKLSVTPKAPTAAKPTAVTGFKATPSTTSVALSWNKNSTADSYQIDIYKNGKWTYLTKTSGTSYTATGLTSGTSYQFRIFAFKGSAYSSSAKVTASTKSASTSKPTAVTGFMATPSTTSVKLTWNKNSTADSYQIDIYKNGKWSYLTKTTGTSYTATGLTAGKSYQFRIFAFKGSAYSSSAKVTASTKSTSASKPSPVTVFNATPASTSSIKLTWSKSANADSYQIDIYKNGKWSYLTKTTGTSYTATGLSSGTSYQFRIFAFKGSAYSTSMKKTASTKPAAVTGLTAAPSSTAIRLNWKASTGADSYQVDMYKNGKWVYVGKTTSTSYNVTGLSSGYSYNFRVFAFKGSSYSASTKLTAFTL